jgi:hypothetical protein
VIRLLGERSAVRLARGTVAFTARTAHGTAQELRLLVLLCEALAAPHVRLLLLRGCVAAGLGGLRARRLEAALVVAARAIVTVAAIVSLMAMPIRAVAESVRVVTSAIALESLSLDAGLRLMLAHGLMLGRGLAVVALVVPEVVARLHCVVRHERTLRPAHAASVHHLSALGHVLVAESHDDAVVVLGVLQIILREHWVA